MTTLLHPDSPNPIVVEADRVAMYKSQGWAEAVEPEQPASEPEPKPKK